MTLSHGHILVKNISMFSLVPQADVFYVRRKCTTDGYLLHQNVCRVDHCKSYHAALQTLITSFYCNKTRSPTPPFYCYKTRSPTQPFFINSSLVSFQSFPLNFACPLPPPEPEVTSTSESASGLFWNINSQKHFPHKF